MRVSLRVQSPLPLSPAAYTPKVAGRGRTGQNGAERGRCGLVRSGPLGRPLRPVDASVKKEAGAKGSGGGRLKERGWGAWLHCAGNAVLRAWLHCAGYWAKGTPCRGPSAGLSVSGSAWLTVRAGVQSTHVFEGLQWVFLRLCRRV